jgi:hypothetical protein
MGGAGTIKRAASWPPLGSLPIEKAYERASS